MSTDVVFPSLSNWTENLITVIYNATSAQTSNVLDSFLSKYAVIKFNGKEISRDDLVKELQGENLLEVEVSIKLLGVVEVSANKDVPLDVIGLYFHSDFVILIIMAVVQAGSVGSYFTVTVQGRDRVRDTPVRKTVTASLNVLYVFDICDLIVVQLTSGVLLFSSIEQDLSISGPPPSPICGNFDRRRVKEVNIVVSVVPVPISPN